MLEIFEMSDLDGNGLLSREEFNFYNLRTSGEEVADAEWEVVEGEILENRCENSLILVTNFTSLLTSSRIFIPIQMI